MYTHGHMCVCVCVHMCAYITNKAGLQSPSASRDGWTVKPITGRTNDMRTVEMRARYQLLLDLGDMNIL